MATENITIDTLNQLDRAASDFLSAIKERRIFAIHGSMGAGKTTLIKAICKQLGSIDVVTSPTFTLVNEYNTQSGDTIYHFDFYRIVKIEEVFDFGFEEYLSSGNWCFIEWPELVESLLPDDVTNVTITTQDDMSRLIEIDL
jgi:tRNA threonylcarbamoyladenosine biosynthesis protein TsaE